MSLIDPKWLKENWGKHTYEELDSLGIELFRDHEKLEKKPGHSIKQTMYEQEGEQGKLL